MDHIGGFNELSKAFLVGKHKVRVGTTDFYEDSFSFLVDHGIIYGGDNSDPVDGVLLEHERCPKGMSVLCLKNGDDGFASLSDYDMNDSCPTISFVALFRLLYPKYLLNGVSRRRAAQRSIARALRDGGLVLVDWRADEWRKMTGKEKINESKQKLGFIRTGERWHKPAAALFRTKTQSFLIGQDEGTYFGVELPTSPNTIADAYKDLIPNEAKGIKGVRRQGEWFVIPVSKKTIKKRDSSKTISVQECVLPKETIDSNDHTVEARDAFIANGVLYAAEFCMNHDEHQSVSDHTGEWFKFVRNTAVRSVSEEGVD